MAVRKLSVVLDLDTSRWSGKLAGAKGDVVNFGGALKSAGVDVDRFGNHLGNIDRRLSSPTARLRDLVVILGQARSAFLTLKDVSVGWLGAIFKQAGELERLTVLMQGLSSAADQLGKQREAASNLTELYKIARTSGFAVQELADSFVKIKSGGIDPMNGSLRGLVDATAAFGGNSDTLHRAAIAIQQMAGKGVISMEELRQQLGEAVPSAMALMARAMDKTLPELAKMIEKGTVEAKPALAKMFAEMERVYSGAGARLSNTLFGQMAQIRTNFAQLSADFTGMGQSDGFFSSTVAKLKELNALMRSTEARAFLNSLGQGVGNVAGIFVSLIETVVRFKDQVGFALKALAIIWAANTMLAGVNKLRDGFNSIIPALQNLRTQSTALGQSTMSAIQYNSAIAMSNAVALDSARAQAARATATAQAAIADEQAAVAAARRAMADRVGAQQAVVSLRAQQVARQNLVASMQAQQLAALNTLQTGRNEQGRFVSQAAATEAYTRATERLRIARGMLATTDVALTNAERALVTAKTQEAVATNAATVATTAATAAVARETVAVAADTAAMRLLTVAKAGAAVASTALGAAVNLALGPIGIIAMLAYQAAAAMGVFETAADRATAAAQRMAQGFADAGDAAVVAGRKAALAKEITELKSDTNGVTVERGDSWWNTGLRVRTPFSDSNAALVRRKEQELAALDARQTQGLRAAGVQRQQAWYDVVMKSHGAYLDNLSQHYNRRIAIIEKGSGTEAQKQAQFASAREAYDTKAAAHLKKRMSDLQAVIDDRTRRGLNAGPAKAAMRQLMEQTQGATSAIARTTAAVGGGGGGKGFPAAFAAAAGNVAKLRDELNGGEGNLAKFNAEVAAGAPKYKDWTKAQIDAVRGQMALKDALSAAKGGGAGVDPNKAFDNQLASTAGKIAQLRDELQGGEGDLASFEAKVKSGAFDGVTPQRLEQMREYLKLVEGLNRDKDVKQVNDRLSGELAKARTEADALWKSFSSDTMEVDKRLAQITSRFAGVTDGLKGEDLANANKIIAEIVANLQRADAADIAQGWRDSAAEIMSSLLSENEQRQRNFDEEVRRQRQLLQLTLAGTEERKRAELAFNQWHQAAQRRLQVENMSTTGRMAKDWAKMGQNIEQTMMNAIAAYVDGIGEADFNTGKFVVGVIKSLVKVIITAMIAYAILSAIGMANNAQGQPVGLGQFLKGQIGGSLGGGGLGKSDSTIGFPSASGQGTPIIPKAHTGGVIGGALQGVTGVHPGLFEHALKYHEGGHIGSRRLMAGERPIIAKDKELMLTEDQQDLLGQRLRNGGVPQVKIEFINNTGQQLNAEAGEPKFDGREFIVGVVVEAASKQGPLRTVLEGMGNK